LTWWLTSPKSWSPTVRLVKRQEPSWRSKASRYRPAALRQWMSRFLDYASAKLGMADALRAVIDSGAPRTPTPGA
jgi:hypothetical protein